MGQDLQLHAQLRHTGVWRRLVVSAEGTFYDLHEKLQVAMGWEGGHLYAFRKGKRTIAVDEAYEAFDGPTPPEGDDVMIFDYLDKVGDRCEYEYDFGDGWVLDLKVEALVDPPENGRWLLGGELAGPPEDCGGVPGYERLCAAIQTGVDPFGEGVEELLEWAGDWRPERFDPEAAMLGLQLGGLGLVEWAGAERTLPFYLREDDDGPAERVRASVWVDVDSGLVLAVELGATLGEALESAIARAGSAPQRVLVEGVEDGQRLRFAFKELEVRREPAEVLEAVWESLLERFDGVGFEPRFVEPGGSPELVERFFAAMTTLQRSAPWKRLGESAYLRMRAPSLDVDAVVSTLGAAGVSAGLVVYSSVECAERFVRTAGSSADALMASGGRVVHATFAKRADLSPAMRRELAERGWSHPRGKVPRVIALDEDGVVAPVVDDDYRVAILAAGALCEVLKRLDELAAGELFLQARVELPGAGLVHVEVSHPVPELEAMEAELDEARLGGLEYDPEADPDPEGWLAADEAERVLAVRRAHEGLEMGESPNLHATTHVIVENLLASGEVPGARIGFARLLEEGMSRHDAIHALGSTVAGEIFGMLKGSTEIDPRALSQSLAATSASEWLASAPPKKSRPRRGGGRRKRKRRKR